MKADLDDLRERRQALSNDIGTVQRLAISVVRASLAANLISAVSAYSVVP
jgi:hypothetical protein